MPQRSPFDIVGFEPDPAGADPFAIVSFQPDPKPAGPRVATSVQEIDPAAVLQPSVPRRSTADVYTPPAWRTDESTPAPRQAEAPAPASFLGRVADLGISALRGAISVPESHVGLLDIPTGGRVGQALEKVGFEPKLAKDILASYYTDQQQRANRSVEEADGFLATAVAALKNPSTILQSVVESAPSMLSSAGAARALITRGVPAVVAAGVGEGVVSAGQAAEDARAPGGRLTAKQSGLAAASGAGTGILGVVGGKLATKLGIADVDTMLAAGVADAGARKGLVRSIVVGAVQEGGFEELPQSVQEQILANISAGKPWEQGVDQAAVMGALAGAVMGGGAQAGADLASRVRPPAAAPAPAVEAQPAAPADAGLEIVDFQPEPVPSAAAPTVVQPTEAEQMADAIEAAQLMGEKIAEETTWMRRASPDGPLLPAGGFGTQPVPPAVEAGPPASREAYIDKAAYDASLRATYTQPDGTMASSRTAPQTAPIPPVGTWAIDESFKTQDGHEIEQLIEVPVENIEVSEDTGPEKWADVERYAQWITDGREAPPIHVTQTDTGRLKAADHRRLMAAKLAGQTTVKAWVSWATPSTREGNPVTGLTYELAQQGRRPLPVQPARPEHTLVGSDVNWLAKKQATREPEQPKRKYASSQFDLPEDVAKDVRALGEMIPEADLAEDGRETESHITLKYGLTADTADELREALKGQGPITVTLGKTSIFPASESGKADVVKIDVDSPELRALNAKVAQAVDAPGDTHPTYQPYVTVAYVKPGTGEKYVGGDAVEGRQITLSEVTFIGKDRSRVTIPLTGQGRPTTAVATEDDDNYRRWQQNASNVAADPENASDQDLQRAAGYLTHRMIQERHTAEKEGRPVNTNLIDSLKREADWYTQIQKRRESAPTAEPQAEPAVERPSVLMTQWAEDRYGKHHGQRDLIDAVLRASALGSRGRPRKASDYLPGVGAPPFWRTKAANRAEQVARVREYMAWSDRHLAADMKARGLPMRTLPSTGDKAAVDGPRTVKYLRNTETAPNMGSRFGQDVEPSGRYVIEDEIGDADPGTGWERGEVTFQNPLVIEWGGQYGEPSNWKNVLSARYDGKTGKALSQAIRADGYDGIITMAGGRTSEIVDLTGQEPRITRQAKPKITYNPGAKTVEVSVPRNGGVVIREALQASGFRQRGKTPVWYKKTKQGADAIPQVEALIAKAQASKVDSDRAQAERGADQGTGAPGVPARVRVDDRRTRAATEPDAEPRTRDTAFAGILASAQAVDPLVPEAELRAEYDARLDILEDLEAVTENEDGRGISILKAIAGYGGLSSETDLKGEVALLKESAGPFGSFGGVPKVFRTTGQSIDDMLTSLHQDPQFAWVTDKNALLEALDDISRNPPPAPPTFEDRLVKAGITEHEPWWRDSWRGQGPAAQPLTADSLQEAMGVTEEQAQQTVALADAIGIRDRLVVVKGGVPGSGAMEQGRLSVVHNLTEKNLLHAARMGGIPVPSLAVISETGELTGFGEITLIGSTDLLEGTPVFGADVYSPRYPTVHWKVDAAGQKALGKIIAATKDVTGQNWYDLDQLQTEGAKYLRHVPGVGVQFLRERGAAVPPLETNPSGRSMDQSDKTRAITSAIESAGIPEAEWHAYTERVFQSLKPTEHIYKGFTYTGRRSYKPHTLENVVKELKKEIRGGESSSNLYGVGQLRSKFTPKFRSLAAIKKAAGRLVSDEQFEAVKKDVEAELFAIAEELSSRYDGDANRFGFTDTVMAVIEDAGRKPLNAVFKDYGFTDVPQETRTRIFEYIQTLKTLPTEYFEAKPLRAVRLNEFAGAVVPSNADPKVIETLTAEGVPVRVYDVGWKIGEKDPNRQAALRSFREELAQRGARVLFQDAVEPAPIFYSALLRATNKLPNRMSPEMALNTLTKQPGVKAEEVKWTGLEPWLKSLTGPVTKAQIVEFLEASQVQVKEVVLGDRKPWSVKSRADVGEAMIAGSPYFDSDAGWFVLDPRGELLSAHTSRESAEDYIREAGGGELTGSPEFATYQTPGGEHYRELLLTLPPKDSRTGLERRKAVYESHRPAIDSIQRHLDAATYRRDVAQVDALFKELQRLREIRDKEADEAYRLGEDQTKFTDGHYDQPNVLAHVRCNDRTGPNGEKILFLEEVQSDWHQKGKREGYRSNTSGWSATKATLGEGPNATAVWRVVDGTGGIVRSIPEGLAVTEQAAITEAVNQTERSLVPDAPFKTTWPELALKRMLRYAAEHVYDQLAWTAGDQQNERYDLSKELDQVWWERAGEGDTRRLMLVVKGSIQQMEMYIDDAGKVTEAGMGTSMDWVGKDVADILGNDMAEKIGATNDGLLEGEGLRLGGSGMRGFYDDILPRFLNKYGKQWGARVGETTIQVEATAQEMRAAGEAVRTDRPLELPVTVHAITLTPQMQRSVVQEGQPLFQGPRGSIEFFDAEDGLIGMIRGLENPNVSTGVHEIWHAARRFLLDRSIPQELREGITDEGILAAERWAGATDGVWDTKAEERFARGGERYLLDGKAPSASLEGLFAKFKAWLSRVYRRLQGSPLDLEISAEMRAVFDRLVTRSERLQAAEAEGDASFDVNEFGEEQPRLPGAEDVREQQMETPTFEAPFSLSSEVSKATKGKQDALFQDDRPTDTPAFKRWFGKSVLVKPDGAPRRLYHGTADDVTAFDLDHPHRKDSGWLGRGVYLTSDPELAHSYANLKGGSGYPRTMPLYAKVENPYYATQRDKERFMLISHRDGKAAGRVAAQEWTEQLQAKGHDGVILEYTADQVGEKNASTEVVVFDPAGVKSATGNRGTFDPSDPNILYQDGAPKPTVLYAEIQAIARKRGISVAEAVRRAERAGYEVVRVKPDTRPRPVSVETGRSLSAEKPIPRERILEFPSLQKLPEAIRADVADLMEQFNGWQPQRRHVQGWDRMNELAKDVAIPLEMLTPGTALNSEELTAYKRALATAYQEQQALVEKVKTGTATGEDTVRLHYLTGVAVMLTQSYRGAKAEAGRALNSLKEHARALELGESRFIDQLLKRSNDLEAVTRDVVATQGDPVEWLKTIRKRAEGDWVDYFNAYFVNSILSGPKTSFRNSIGTAINISQQIVNPVTAAPLDWYRAKQDGKDRTVYLGEVEHAALGALAGVQAGVRNGWFAFKEGFRPSDVDRARAGWFDTPNVELPGGAWTNWPTRALLAQDEFMRSIAKSAALYSGAYAVARQQYDALQGTLAQPAERRPWIAKRMADILTNVDPMTHDGRTARRLIEEAEDVATRSLFQEDPGKIVDALLALKGRHQHKGTRLVMTQLVAFMKTPANVTRQGVEFSPIGFLMESAKKGGREGAQARGRAAMGSLILAPIVWHAMMGGLTGAPPDDRAEREEFYALGKIGNAVKVGGYWVRYTLFQPANLLFSSVAEAVDSWQHGQKDDMSAWDAAMRGAFGAIRSVMDQSFLTGLNSFVDAVNDNSANSRFALRWLSRFVQGMMPYSGLQRNLAQAVDPVVRNAEGPAESVQEITIGASKGLPPRRDRFGEPVTRPGSVAGQGAVGRMAVPEVSRALDDAFVLELSRLGVRPVLPPATLTDGGERVALTKDQERVLQEALGRERKQAIVEAMQRSGWATTEDADKVERLERAMATASRGVRLRAIRAARNGREFTLERLLSARTWRTLRDDQERVSRAVGAR